MAVQNKFEVLREAEEVDKHLVQLKEAVTKTKVDDWAYFGTHAKKETSKKQQQKIRNIT